MALKTKSGAKTIDTYLASLSADKRAALERVRKIVRRTAPKAEECVSYGIPAFRLNGLLVGFGATLRHCAFYPMSASTVAAHNDELSIMTPGREPSAFRPTTRCRLRSCGS